MSRYRLSTFIAADHNSRLDALAARTRLSKSEIVAAAISAYLSPDGSDKREALTARLDRLGRQYQRLERDQTILIETVALFIRHSLTISAPIPAAHQEAAVAQGRERFRQFVAQLARQLTLVIALNYGSQDEIARAAQALACDAAAGRIDPAEITPEMITSKLDTADLPAPDLVIRTSGEQRLSNFLMWQAAYAELLFTDELWPDFNEASLAAALKAFGQRERRFGGR